MEQREFEKRGKIIASRVGIGISDLIRKGGSTGPPLPLSLSTHGQDQSRRAGQRWEVKEKENPLQER